MILNSGILHRVGASRLYVNIARALAEDGIRTLRFDFSGIGDSEVRKDALSIEERFVVETRESMDHLQTVLGVDRFIVGGLCSGADGAFWAGLADERIVGIWQIDAFCYKTPGYFLRRYGPRVLDPRAWAHSIRVRLPRREEEGPDQEIFVSPDYSRVFPPRATVQDGLGKLLGREVDLFFFFTGGLEEYNYASQHADAFSAIDLGRRAEVHHIHDCTHMVTDLEHQRRLLSRLRNWFARITGFARSDRQGADVRVEASCYD